MMKVSVTMITKNEAHCIERTLESVSGLTDDIVVVDSGSTDNTVELCKKFNANVIVTDWKGYGETKNMGNAAAKYDWILSLDADECVDDELRKSILQLTSNDLNIIYKLKRKNFFCQKEIRFGEWSGDTQLRIFNRTYARWNHEPVHENLIFSPDAKIVPLSGALQHYTVNNLEEYIKKIVKYAKLNAVKYFNQNKKASVIKLFMSPLFTFVKNYFLKLGFLDGWNGFLIAKTTAWYTFLKYSFLREMNQTSNK